MEPCGAPSDKPFQGVITYVALRAADPPPDITRSLALGPIIAMFSAAFWLSGRRLFRFFNRTIPSAANERQNFLASGESRERSMPSPKTMLGFFRACCWTKVSRFMTRSSIVDVNSFCADRQCRTSCGVLHRGGPGISKSRPALMAASTLYVPYLRCVDIRECDK